MSVCLRRGGRNDHRAAADQGVQSARPPLKPGWYVWPIYGGGCNVLHVSADLKITAYPLEEGLQKWVKDSIE